MLKRFEVRNYKNFDQSFMDQKELDTARIRFAELLMNATYVSMG